MFEGSSISVLKRGDNDVLNGEGHMWQGKRFAIMIKADSLPGCFKSLQMPSSSDETPAYKVLPCIQWENM